MTRTGIGALAAGLVLVAVGAALVWPALVVLGVVPVVLVVLGVGYVLKRPRMRIEREIHPRRVPKGETAIAYLTLTNEGMTAIPATTAVQPYGEGAVRTVFPRLVGGESGVRTYRLPTSTRGIFDLGPLEVARSDPFELLRATERHAGTDQIWVSPRVYPYAPLPSGLRRHLEGPTADTAPQGTITFHRLREYEVGDDLRMIHWKSTARTGQLMVRHNVDTSQPYTVVVLDRRPAAYAADCFETAVDAAASAVTAVSTGKSPVQLRATGGQQVGGHSERTPVAALDFLTAVKPEARGSIAEEIALLRREHGGTALVVVTGVLDPSDLQAIATLRDRFERVVVLSVAEHPRAAPHFPGVQVVAAGQGEKLCAAWNLAVAGW